MDVTKEIQKFMGDVVVKATISSDNQFEWYDEKQFDFFGDITIELINGKAFVIKGAEWAWFSTTQ